MANTPKKLLAGGKFSGRHTSIIPPALPLLFLIRDFPEITKITLGIILPGGGKGHRLRFKLIPAGLELKVIGHSASQLFFVHTKEPGKVQVKIESEWAALRGQ